MEIINRIRKVLNLMKVGISSRLMYLYIYLLFFGLFIRFFLIQEINPIRQLVRLVRVEQEA